MNKKKFKNPMCAILWKEAFYTFNKNFPKKFPLPQLTVGFIISSNKKMTNIATNVNYNQKTSQLWPVDGFLIPQKTVVEFRKIQNFND